MGAPYIALAVKRLLALCVLAALFMACGGDSGEQQAAATTRPRIPTPLGAVGSSDPTVTPTVALTSTPRPPATVAPEPSATLVTPPSGGGLSIELAEVYFDALSSAPGWESVDPASVELSNAHLGLGPEFSEVTVYLSPDPFQTIFMYMVVAAGPLEIAANRAQLRNVEFIESQFLQGFHESAPEAGLTFDRTVPPVGGDASLIKGVGEFEGLELQIEMLVFMQERGDQAALVFIGSFSYPFEPPAADIVEVGRAVIDRLCTDGGC